MLLEKITSPADVKLLTVKEMEQLASEIRAELMRTVPVTGGHLAANLGVVELTIAMVYVFDVPEDKIVWDVGHQSYVYKMLTGRKDRMQTMRQLNGLSGFPKPCESEYDSFGTGHSSTAISAALGMAVARDLDHKNYKVAAVVGDGSMTGGLSFEGLNNCGQIHTPMMIVLNDNGMSISRNVGALSNYLSKIRSSRRYAATKDTVKSGLSKIPVIGRVIAVILEKTKKFIKALLVPNVLFEQLNITYVGTVDGHNIKKLIRLFEDAKNYDSPVLVHVKTVKGKGIDYIEKHPEKFHSVSENCVMKDIANQTFDEQYIPTSYSLMLGKKLSELAENNDKIVALTAAMAEGTGLLEFSQKHGDRFFDVGIAEQHEVTFAAGLAISGKKPFVAVYSSFLQRGYDQLIHDVAIQDLPVVFCIDRAGITGRDGETHNGQFDLAMLLAVPGMTVFAPSSLNEFSLVIDYASTAKGPVAIRYGKGKPHEHELVVSDDPLLWNCSLQDGTETVAIFATGTMVEKALSAKAMLKAKGIQAVVINMLSVKPLDYAMLDRMSGIKKWITAEDGSINGGVGSYIASYASGKGFDVTVRHIGIPDEFPRHGSIDEILELCRMRAEDIVSLAEEM